MAPIILIVEDNTDLQQYVAELLLDNGYIVKTAGDGASALKIVKKSLPNLVILDLVLPDVSGETICQEIKKMVPNLPVIILTAKDTLQDIVHGLTIGADDYISKPFAGEELLARIKARLRDQGDSTLSLADLSLNQATLEVKRDDKMISLGPKEFKLLQYLLLNKGKVLTREMILNRVWSYSPDVETRVVDIYMGYLRKKIDREFDKKLLHTIRGFGYTIKE